MNLDKQFNFLPAIDNYNLWTNVDVIRGGLLGAGVGLIEGKGEKCLGRFATTPRALRHRDLGAILHLLARYKLSQIRIEAMY